MTEKDLSDNLLLVPEHTWGMCLSVYFNDATVWYNEDFKKTENSEQRKIFESSWQEQRDYVTKAAEVLGYDLK